MKRPFILLIAMILACIGTVAPVASAAGERATFVKTSDWGSGWEGRFTVTNGGTSTISSWRVEFDLPAGTGVGSYWDALLTSSGNHHTFANREYNGSLAPGASASFGFIGTGPGSPQNCRVNGLNCGGGGGPDIPRSVLRSQRRTVVQPLQCLGQRAEFVVHANQRQQWRAVWFVAPDVL